MINSHANFWYERVRKSWISKALIASFIGTQMFIAITLLFGFVELFSFLTILVVGSWAISLILVVIMLAKRLEVVPQIFTCVLYLLMYAQAMLFNYLVNVDVLKVTDILSVRTILGFFSVASIAVLPLAFSDNSAAWFVSILIVVSAIFLVAIGNSIQALIYFDLVRWIVLICVCGGILVAFIIYLARYLHERKTKIQYTTAKAKVTNMVAQNMIGGIISPMLIILGILTIGDAFILDQNIMVWIFSIPTILVGIYFVTLVF